MSRPPALNEDPFNAMMSTLEAQLKSLRIRFDGWRAQVHSVDTAADAGFKAKMAELKGDIARASAASGKMREALANVEQHRVKFPHIDDRELGARKAFVERLEAVRSAAAAGSCRCALRLLSFGPPPPPHTPPAHPHPRLPPRQVASRIRAEFHSPDVQGKLASDERRALAKRMRDADDARPQTAHAQGNAAHLAATGNEQLVVRKQQDVVLDKMSAGLDTLNEMAVVIDAELKDQDKILEDIDTQTTAAQNKMDQAIKHIEKLIGKPGCCSGNSCQLCVAARARRSPRRSPLFLTHARTPPSLDRALPAGAPLAFSY